MATSTRIPIEVYLRSSEYEPDADYVDGRIEERPMGEYSHAAWQFAIQFWFGLNAAKWNIYVLPELRVQTSPTRFRVPDVAILDAAIAPKPITTHPPIAVFEVLSLEDTPSRLIYKLEDYAVMGIAEIWVVNPEMGSFQRFEDGHLIVRTSFSLPDRNIDFDMSEIAKLVR